MSLGAVAGTQQVGLRVPEDVSLVGFDDLEWTTIITPPLTVVAQPVYELGATAATRLIARIQGDAADARTFTLATTFMLRASTGPAPDAVVEPAAAGSPRRP
jgi:LacI family transcriptional regulator